MSIESGAVILVDSSGNEIAVQDGVATPASQRGYHLLGSDGTNSRFFQVDTAGRSVITGAETPGSAPTAKPVLVAGNDGTNVRTFKTTSNGAVWAALTDGTDTVGISTVGSDKALKVDVIQSVGGASNGTIADGVSSTIKATVLDYTNSNPLAVRLTDPNGDYIAAGGGTEYTEDAAAPANPVGGQLMARRRDTLSSETTTDGDVTALNSTAKGELYVKHADAVTATQGTAAAANAPWATRLSDGTSFYKTNTDTQLPASLVGGRLDTNIGAWLGSTAPTVGSKTSANSIPVVIASDQAAVTIQQSTASSLKAQTQGEVAADLPVSGNPVLMGGRASDATPTAMSADGDAVVAWHDRRGAYKTALVGDSGTTVMDGANNAVRVNIVAGSSSGTTYTEDAASVADPVGGQLMARRRDTLATETSTDGDVTALNSTGKGELYVKHADAMAVTATQLPASLVGGRLDVNTGTWLGSTAPTVGQKTMANSLPVAIASDQGALSVTPAGNVAHDAVDSGNPVKVGFKAELALPAAVADGDRADGSSDRWGRQLSAHIDPGMQVWKQFNATALQNAVSVWTPTSGKKIAITSIVIGSYGTTAGRLILWFGDSADSSYTIGTDQLALAASFAPSNTSKPGLVFTPMTPIFCTTADRQLKITTDAALSIDITLYGYEW